MYRTHVCSHSCSDGSTEAALLVPAHSCLGLGIGGPEMGNSWIRKYPERNLETLWPKDPCVEPASTPLWTRHRPGSCGTPKGVCVVPPPRVGSLCTPVVTCKSPGLAACVLGLW